MKQTYVFIVGAPRSGTTWMQLMLARHPQVGTCQETHLFSSYLAPMERAWRKHQQDNRGIGLQAVLEYEKFIKYQRKFALSILNNISDTPVIVEKTPGHVRHYRHILNVLPEVLFINVIRDPRAVVNSLVAAAQGWGSRWASRDIIENAKVWKSDVKRGQMLLQEFPQSCVEVRYESLIYNAADQLRNIFHWLNLEADKSLCDRIAKETCFENIKRSPEMAPWRLDREPVDFFRRGTEDSWKEELSNKEISRIESVVHDEMISLDCVPYTKKRHLTAADRKKALSGWRAKLAKVNIMRH